jgi:hypothetical protein
MARIVTNSISQLQPAHLARLMAKEGKVLGYAKYSDCPETGIIIRKEAHFLEYLQHLGLKESIIPNLLYHGTHNAGYIMISTPVALHRLSSETSLTQRHINVLREFAGRTGSKRTADLLRQIRYRIDALRTVINTLWYARLSRAVAVIASTSNISTLATALSHGDFAPWNLNIDRRSGRLGVFDWEHSQTDQFLLWDAFHFKTQVDILMRGRSAAASVMTTLDEFRRSPLIRELLLSAMQIYALYIGYLVDASIQWFEDRQVLGSGMTVGEFDQEMRGQMLDVAIHCDLALSQTTSKHDMWPNQISDRV